MSQRIIPRLERGYLVKNSKKEEWGEGVILSVDNRSSRDNARIQILFPNLGYKEFQMKSFNLDGVYSNTKLSDHEINKWILNKQGVTSFWHITHMTNIDNIYLNGLLSNSEINSYEELIHEDISSQGVQEIRKKNDPIYQKKIHDYVPLFINPKNAMLFSVQKKHQDHICLIEVSLDVLNSQYLFTDGNAAKYVTNFYSDVASEYQKIPWKDVFKDSWQERYMDHNHIFYEKNEEIMSHMQSEFLIYPKIDRKFIKKIYCKNKGIVDFVEGRLEAFRYDSGLESFLVENDPNKFY